MKMNLLLAIIVLSANFVTAQTSTKTAVTNSTKTIVTATPKSTSSTTVKAATTAAKPVVKKKSTTASPKSTTAKKPSISGSTKQGTTAKTVTSTTETLTTIPAAPIIIQGTTIPVKSSQTNSGTTSGNGQTAMQIKGGSDSSNNTDSGNQTKGGTTPNGTQPTQPQIKGGTDNNNQNLNGGGIINTISDITQGDAASAIKEALMKGVSAGVSKVSVTDGYFGNSFIKIPFPQDVQIVESTLRSFGMGSMIDNLVLSLNRAAENAAVQAGPIFLNGIKQMTLNDAISIVSNKQPDAATQFLQRTTTESLVSAFKPSIQTALDKTLATKYWSDITGYYNKIPFVSPVNTNLPDYVTRKAITGLFYMVAQEEAKIRKDPINQGSDIINKVFGAFKK